MKYFKFLSFLLLSCFILILAASSCAEPAAEEAKSASTSVVGSWEVQDAKLTNTHLSDVVIESIRKSFLGTKLNFKDDGHYIFYPNTSEAPVSKGNWNYDANRKELKTKAEISMAPDIKYSVQELGEKRMIMSFTQEEMGTTIFELERIKE